MRSLSTFIAFSLLSLFALSCKEKQTQNPGQAARAAMGPLTVEGFIVREQTISDIVEVPGSLLPSEETQIRAEVTGRVVKLNVNEGATVKGGTLLVKLFDEDLQAQLRQLEV